MCVPILVCGYMGSVGFMVYEQVTAPTFASQGNEAAEGIQNNPGARNQAGNQLPGQSLPQAMHIPLGATIPVPSLNLVGKKVVFHYFFGV